MPITMAFQEVLQEILAGKHTFQGSELYEKSNALYFTVFESGIKPAVIAQPTTVQEVSALIKKLHPHLVTQEASLAIKGSGHTPFAGIYLPDDTLSSSG